MVQLQNVEQPKSRNLNVWNSQADHGYSRRANFGGSVVRSMFEIYSPEGTNVYGSKGGSLRG